MSDAATGDTLNSLAYLHGVSPVTASFKQQPEHFEVTELLDPQAEQAGEHQWLWVEKRGANTPYVAGQLAKFAGVSERQVSYAGLKDRHAVTRQWFSVQLPGQPLLAWQDLKHDEFSVQRALLQPRKLKTGAHQGNGFTLRLESVSDLTALQQRWQLIAEKGVPNYFGAQRFGHNGQNIAKAKLWFAGQLRQRLSRTQQGLLLSAARALLFNEVVSARIAAGRLMPEPGDAMILAGSQSYFIAEADDPSLLARHAEGDVQLSAPLPGSGRGITSLAIAEFEAKVLADHVELVTGLQKHRVDEARRPLLLRPQQPEFKALDERTAELRFNLPKGSFATSILRELIITEFENQLLR